MSRVGRAFIQKAKIENEEQRIERLWPGILKRDRDAREAVFQAMDGMIRRGMYSGTAREWSLRKAFWAVTLPENRGANAVR